MSAGDSTAESPKKSRNRRLVAIAVVIVLALGFLVYAVTQSTPPTNPTTYLPRSGPISTYPAAWGFYSSCPGFNSKGNTTTLGLGSVAYPNSWNATYIVTLTQIYGGILNDPSFARVTLGHGWVVYSWVFNEGGSGNMPPYSNDIIGYFILTNGASPNGYVTAYYDIQNGEVTLGNSTTTVTVVCPSFTTG
jgi:hypothetical protein